MELMQHQKEGVEFLLQRGSGGLFFEMRCGKSLTLLETLKRLSQTKDIYPILIVAPLSVLPVWPSEAEKFGYDFKFSTLTGNRPDRLKKIAEPADIYIINYEGARIYFKELMAKGFKVVAADESHRCKGLKAAQTRCLLELGYKAQHRFILTGTPITKSPEDLWSQLQFVKPGFLGNFWAFRSRYIEFKKMRVRSPNGLREISVPYRFKNLKELEEKKSQLCLRKVQAECFDLPEKSYKTIYCTMEGDQLKSYFEMKHGLQTEINEKRLTVKNALTQIGKMQQICHGFVYDDDGKPNWLKFNCKLPILLDLLEDIKSEKVVLFCNFRADLELIELKLKENEINYVLYDGKERQLAIDKFNLSPDPVVFLTTIELGKEGINLSAACHVIYYGRNYNYASRYQSEARIQSAFQTRNLIYYDLVCHNTIDEKVLDVLKMKGDIADKILGDSIRLAMMAATDNQEEICQ